MAKALELIVCSGLVHCPRRRIDIEAERCLICIFYEGPRWEAEPRSETITCGYETWSAAQSVEGVGAAYEH